MNNLEFRAWHEEAEEYLEGSVSNTFKWLEDGQSIVIEQFTGLHDCDGVKIFDGDTIECKEQSVKWIVLRDDRGCFVAANPENNLDFVFLDDLTFKVIGNIHQHAHLLEK